MGTPNKMMQRNSQTQPSVELCTQIVEAVAQVKDVDPLSLAPLRDSVDTDALDRLFDSQNQGLQVTFEYEGYTVTVQGDRQIDLAE